MNRSWVRFPQAAQIRPPGSGWAFLYTCLLLVPRWCSGRRRARLWGRAALCARGRRPAREPSAPRASLGASPRSPARPRHRPRAPQPGPPVPPAPSTPVGLGVLTCACASARSPARPRRSSQALWTPNVVWLVVLGFWGAPLCVVTNVVNRRCFPCGFLIRCYKRRQSDGFFAENQGFWTQIDDVCNRDPREAM